MGSNRASVSTAIEVAVRLSRANASRRRRHRMCPFASRRSNTTALTLLLDSSTPTQAQVPTADSNHRPKLVKATITVSIQYWERTAS
jgi:hypothetical protein